MKTVLPALTRQPAHPSQIWATSLALLFLAAALVLAWMAYAPGLAGGFLFDDYPNLKALGAYNGVTSWRKLELYLADGIGGPTGRPISLLSFLLDAHNWPADPYPFKRTNLLLHLLNGLLLFYLSFQLTALSAGKSGRTAVTWTAALAVGWWLLNSLHVSTTLYVVQRMTQISTLFTLLGILGYVQARSLLPERSVASHVWMTISLLFCGALATLSKENGALLPIYLLLLEYLLLRRYLSTQVSRYWELAFLWVPTVSFVGYLAYTYVTNTLATDSFRPFTSYERLLTEARILFDYLEHLIIPHIQTRGLFHDNYLISHGLLQPVSTLPAVLGVAVLALLAVVIRNRAPYVSWAIGFFLAGHLLESTTIPLELYFEHRNYLPSAFLMLPVARLAVDWFPRKRLLVSILCALLIAPQAYATRERAALWADTTLLYLVWAKQTPESPRAQFSAADVLTKIGRPDLALDVLDNAAKRLPQNLVVAMQRVSLKIGLGAASPEDFENLRRLGMRAAFDGQTLPALDKLVAVVTYSKASRKNDAEVHALIDALLHNPNYRNKGEVFAYFLHTQGVLYLSTGHAQEGAENLAAALAKSHDIEMGMMQTAILASRGYPDLALRHLQTTRSLLLHSSGGRRRLSESEYLKEMDRIAAVLKSDVDQIEAGPITTREKVEPIDGASLGNK